MVQYSPKPYKLSGEGIQVELDLSNYATKADLKEEAYVDRSILETKLGLASLKAELDKVDIVKLKTVSVDLSKIRVDKNVVKKTVHDTFVTKVNASTRY